MINNIWLKSAVVFFLVSRVYAGPEKHDHLEDYKKSTVTINGPAEESVENSKGEKIAKAVYIYNDKKQISEIQFYTNNTKDGRNVFIYDEQGLKQEELYDKNNRLVEKVIYDRNKLNEVVAYEVFDKNNQSQLKWLFSYKDGRLTSGNRYIDKDLTERFVNTYTATEIKQEIFVDNNENAGSITEYLENSRIVRRVKNDFTGSKSIDYFYDKSGRIEKLIFYNHEENTEPKIEKTHLFQYSMPLNVQPVKVTSN